MTVDWSAVPGVLAACAALFLLYAFLFAWTRPKPKPEPARPPRPPNPAFEWLKQEAAVFFGFYILVGWPVLVVWALKTGNWAFVTADSSDPVLAALGVAAACQLVRLLWQAWCSRLGRKIILVLVIGSALYAVGLAPAACAGAVGAWLYRRLRA